MRKICIAIHLLYCDRKVRQQARIGALGRRRACWGARGACVGRAGGSWALDAGRAGALQARGGATGAAGAHAAGAQQQRAGRVGNWRQARHGRRGARLGTRCARGTASLGVAWALDGCAGWASFGALCTWLSYGSVFGPGSTRYFPESPNEHCSL